MPRQALKLNQVIALEKGVKADAERVLTNGYHQAQSASRLSGVTKTYQPRDDEGEKLPPEGVRLQLRASEIVDEVSKALTRLFDVQLTKDAGNQVAVADVVIGDTMIAEKVPVTFLLALEKKLVDLYTFVSKLPVLDPAETWVWSDNDGAFIAMSQTTRTKKVPRNHEKAPATDKHAAQVEVYYEDTIVGTWTTTKQTGAFPPARVAMLKARVVALQEAVKVARETANATVAPDQQIGAKIFDYLLAQ